MIPVSAAIKNWNHSQFLACLKALQFHFQFWNIFVACESGPKSADLRFDYALGKAKDSNGAKIPLSGAYLDAQARLA
jgi:hypothetical protein